MYSYKLFSGCLILICLACSSPPKIPFEMPDVPRIQSIEIEDDWNGLSETAPEKAHFNLRRKNSVWSGEANFTVGRPPISAQANVVIPDSVMNKALRKFSKVKLSKKQYNPKFTHTDDYPRKRFLFRLANDSVVFFSSSQGRNNTPWSVLVSNGSYVTKSSAASKAIEILSPYLQYEIFDSLKAVYRARFDKHNK